MTDSSQSDFLDKLLHNRFMKWLYHWEPGWKEAMILIIILTAYFLGWLETLWLF